MKKKYVIVILLIALPFTVLFAQATEGEQVIQRTADRGDILIEQEEFSAEIDIRVPEQAVLPRRRADEIRYTLAFLREQFLKSNRLLY